MSYPIKLKHGFELQECYERGGRGKARGQGVKRLARGALAYYRGIYGKGNVKIVMARKAGSNTRLSCIVVRDVHRGQPYHWR